MDTAKFVVKRIALLPVVAIGLVVFAVWLITSPIWLLGSYYFLPPATAERIVKALCTL